MLFSGIAHAASTSTVYETTIAKVQFSSILYVGGSGPGNYSSINQAICNATDGDTVFVFDDSSPYYENVFINKKIKLVGENRQTTIIDAQYSGFVVSISSSEVVVTNFTLTHGTTGIHVKHRMNNLTISKNSITENTGAGINFSDFCEYNTLADNTITKNQNGTIFSAGSYNNIYGNTFSYNQEYGLGLIMWCNENTIHQNNFIGNKINAFFFLSALNDWNRNYWNRPRILPKPIFGLMGIIPWLNFDLRPLRIPYDSGE